MRDSLLGRRAEGLDVGGDHDACGPAEQHRLDVIPLARDRVHVVRFPEAFEYFVLAGDQRREIDQHHRRLALDFPAADADADAFVVEALAPGLQQIGVLLELRVDALVREVGTQQDVAVCEFAGDGLRFGRNDGVDAADLVAYFPTYFEQQIGGVFGIAHILMLICNFWNVASVTEYIGGAPAEAETLTDRDRFNEYVMTRLRTAEGIDLREAERLFGKERAARVLRDAEPWLKSRTLVLAAGRMAVPPARMLVSDAVIETFFETEPDTATK